MILLLVVSALSLVILSVQWRIGVIAVSDVFTRRGESDWLFYIIGYFCSAGLGVVLAIVDLLSPADILNERIFGVRLIIFAIVVPTVHLCHQILSPIFWVRNIVEKKIKKELVAPVTGVWRNFVQGLPRYVLLPGAILWLGMWGGAKMLFPRVSEEYCFSTIYPLIAVWLWFMGSLAGLFLITIRRRGSPVIGVVCVALLLLPIVIYWALAGSSFLLNNFAGGGR